MPHNRNLTDTYTCYLTPQAKEFVDKCLELGLDQDLAIVTLEAMWPEELVYDIPADNKEKS